MDHQPPTSAILAAIAIFLATVAVILDPRDPFTVTVSAIGLVGGFAVLLIVLFTKP